MTIKSNKDTISVTFNLDPITVTVVGDVKNNKEFLKLAEKEVIKKLQVKFTRYSYAVIEGNALSSEDAKIGNIVTVEGKTAIITGVNRKTINAVLNGGKLIRGSIGVFAPAININPENLDWKQDTKSLKWLGWTEGKVGYLVVDNEIKPVVVAGKKTKDKYKLYLINGHGRHYTVTEAQLKSLFADRQDAVAVLTQS